MDKKDTAKDYCRILFDILLKKGVRDLILSPGSRNAPLLIAADCRPFRKHVIIDERMAAFVADGISLAGKRPVGLVCTSGTALYDYSPAVAEAFYQHLPLIVISADRPAEWIDQDDSQTLHQPDALSMIVKGSFDIPVQNKLRPEEKWYVNRIVNEAVNLALCGQPGPVHINVRLDNPLSETIPYTEDSPEFRSCRVIDYEENLNLPPHVYKQLSEELKGKKIMLTAGFMQPDDALNKAVKALAQLPNVVCFCETVSNLHLSGDVYSIDTTLTMLDKDNKNLKDILCPDVVISIGGALVSRMLKALLRNWQPEEHWTLADTSSSSDCFMSLTRHIAVRPDKFFRGITKYLLKDQNISVADNYKNYWSELRRKAVDSACRFINDSESWSELKAFDYMLRNIPSTFNLFVSNGTSIRYAQLFSSNIPHSTFSCRGVSGIDGTNAVAAGCAMSYAGSTLLITGDMSLAYDTDVLGLTHIPDRMKIVVINNRGGGIFRFIPSTQRLHCREELFCAPPSLPLEKLATAYSWNYMKVSSSQELEEHFLPFLASRHKAILEICVDGEESARTLINFMNRH